MKLFIISCLLFFSFSHAWGQSPKWQQLKGDNFIIYYKNAPEDFAHTVLKSAEDEFDSVTSKLGISRYQGWGWEKRASIYIYDDEEDYVKNSGQAGWSHGAASPELKIIQTFPANYGFFDSLLPHELGHIILREFIGFSADAPVWFEEGVAMHMEKAKRVESKRVVREAIEKGQFIPLSKLTHMRLYGDSDQATVDLFYAESASIIYFLITEFGESHFYKFCKELKANTPFETALTKTYLRIKSLDDLNKKWVNHLTGN